MFTRAGENER